mgnify:CR=1 FL=1|jgi:hypothetical protein|tara:strand:- start:1605 stop:1835 length:231 start_codon:yes stop_codon:yes gene_type:complete
MDVGTRSKKYVAFHMFETFNPIFNNYTMVQGLWHEADGEIRYEALMAEDKNGKQLSYLFPIFDPNSDEFDDYPLDL